MYRQKVSREYSDTKDVLLKLSEAGFERFYEQQNYKIIVQESDLVKVKISFAGNDTFTQPIFPQIGNPVQIIATILLVVGCYFIGLDSLFMWTIGIGGGQVISFLFNYPKIKNLQNKVVAALSN